MEYGVVNVGDVEKIEKVAPEGGDKLRTTVRGDGVRQTNTVNPDGTQWNGGVGREEGKRIQPAWKSIVALGALAEKH